jgi:hypothetical protein
MPKVGDFHVPNGLVSGHPIINYPQILQSVSLIHLLS